MTFYENMRIRIPYFTYSHIGMFCYEFPMVSFRPPIFLPIAYCTTWNSITKIQLQLYIGVDYKRFFTSHSVQRVSIMGFQTIVFCTVKVRLIGISIQHGLSRYNAVCLQCIQKQHYTAVSCTQYRCLPLVPLFSCIIFLDSDGCLYTLHTRDYVTFLYIGITGPDRLLYDPHAACIHFQHMEQHLCCLIHFCIQAIAHMLFDLF